jgi:hypothetical protein
MWLVASDELTIDGNNFRRQQEKSVIKEKNEIQRKKCRLVGT